MGSERQRDFAVDMRFSLVRFKLTLRWYKKHAEESRKNALAHKLAESDVKGFRKNVRTMNNAKTKVSHALDSIEGDSNVAEMWKLELSSRFTCVNDSACMLHTENIRCTVPSVKIQELALDVCKFSSD